MIGLLFLKSESLIWCLVDDSGRSYNPPTVPFFPHKNISRDPIRYEGGTNLYEYVNKRAMNKVDPLGLVSMDESEEKPDYLMCLARCIEDWDPLDNLCKGLLSAGGGSVPKSALGLRKGFHGASRLTSLPSAGVHYAMGSSTSTVGSMVRFGGRAMNAGWMVYGVGMAGVEIACASYCATN